MLEATPVPDQHHARPDIIAANQKYAGDDYAVKHGSREEYDYSRASRIVQKALAMAEEHAATGGVVTTPTDKSLAAAEAKPAHSDEYADEIDQTSGTNWQYQSVKDVPRRKDLN